MLLTLPSLHYQCKGIYCFHPRNVCDQLQLLVPSLSAWKRASSSEEALPRDEEMPITYLESEDEGSRDPPEISYLLQFNSYQHQTVSLTKIRIEDYHKLSK